MKTSEQIGIVILAAEGAFAIWSAINPSRFTIRKFMSNAKDYQDIRWGFVVASVLIGLLVAAVMLVYTEKKLLTAVTLGAGAALIAYLLGMWQTVGVQAATKGA